ncbi:N-acetyl-gamma-glutamyl-phosphate reductase [Pseudomonas japonica]|uniref:N-acetyl-gamma-glutamyl-phosphate reductase n=1 Tax=Pseudomonas japonica TaxID=256466 RepID=UPI0015E432B7|nr:N-acetyl-gamma-glutamyl-phosphate reductase [Pseudomonas japonica]MBA1244183.1 N-acetyl-gamma-glutamyl-phosphate reductase [Pseudomonas japonica]
MSKPVVFIDGDQGTTGLQIHARLGGRQDIELLTLPEALRKDPAQRAEAINSADIALLCLPDDAALEAVASIHNPAVRVIDASSAHRVHPDWVYGLPELNADQAERIAHASRVSNPGCYPTGAIALLRPLIQAGLVPADYPMAIHAISGYSGAGRATVERHEAGEESGVRVYGLSLEHKHVPEIQQRAGLGTRPFFVPGYGNYRQGIVLTIPLMLRLLPAGVSTERLQQCLEQAYQGAAHVQVAAPSSQVSQLDPEALNGTDDVRLHVFGNDAQGQVLLAAVFDNLGKGAAGAAVQNLDLMLMGQP